MEFSRQEYYSGLTFSRESSWLRDWTWVICIAGRCNFYPCYSIGKVSLLPAPHLSSCFYYLSLIFCNLNVISLGLGFEWGGGTKSGWGGFYAAFISLTSWIPYLVFDVHLENSHSLLFQILPLFLFFFFFPFDTPITCIIYLSRGPTILGYSICFLFISVFLSLLLKFVSVSWMYLSSKILSWGGLVYHKPWEVTLHFYYSTSFSTFLMFLSLSLHLFLHTVWCCCCQILQSCPTLCDPRDGSPPGSPSP